MDEKRNADIPSWETREQSCQCPASLVVSLGKEKNVADRLQTSLQVASKVLVPSLMARRSRKPEASTQWLPKSLGEDMVDRSGTKG